MSYPQAVTIYLGEAVSKAAAFHSTQATWRAKEGKSARAFGRQSIPMTWDYAEVNPFADAGGSLDELFESARQTVATLPACAFGQARQVNAADNSGLQLRGEFVVSTDPPYYNNVDYADLSDYYYIWLRRSLAAVTPDLFVTVLVPKAEELVATPYRYSGDKDAAEAFFEQGLEKAFLNIHKKQNADYPLAVYYAFKQAEAGDDEDEDDLNAGVSSTGWETMLEGLVKAGFTITGTWPMRTESISGLKNVMNSLASSIVLVCRSRPSNAALATRKEFMAALRQELPEALKNLQHGNIAPVDLAQAAIGPGMAVFTRYSKVIETGGSSMTVRAALGIINQVLDEVLAEQEGEFDGDTRWALAWFEQFGTGEGPFGVAETLSKAKVTSVAGLVEAKVVKARGGKVQLIGRADLPDDWDPASDKRLTVWETTQYLIRALETKGEGEAAALLRKLGGIGEAARDLAYRLYSICERKKWADEALAYNGLVIAWPELTKLALSERSGQPSTQQDLFS